MSFRETYTTDELIMIQWIDCMCNKAHKEDESGKIKIHRLYKSNGSRILISVFNNNTYKSFRCIVPAGLENYGLARCYARSNGEKVMTLVNMVPRDVAIQYSDFIAQDIFNVSDSEGNTKICKGKYTKYCGETAKILSNEIKKFNLMTESNHYFFIEDVHVYDLD